MTVESELQESLEASLLWAQIHDEPVESALKDALRHLVKAFSTLDPDTLPIDEKCIVDRFRAFLQAVPKILQQTGNPGWDFAENRGEIRPMPGHIEFVPAMMLCFEHLRNEHARAAFFQDVLGIVGSIPPSDFTKQCEARVLQSLQYGPDGIRSLRWESIIARLRRLDVADGCPRWSCYRNGKWWSRSSTPLEFWYAVLAEVLSGIVHATYFRWEEYLQRYREMLVSRVPDGTWELALAGEYLHPSILPEHISNAMVDRLVSFARNTGALKRTSDEFQVLLRNDNGVPAQILEAMLDELQPHLATAEGKAEFWRDVIAPDVPEIPEALRQMEFARRLNPQPDATSEPDTELSAEIQPEVLPELFVTAPELPQLDAVCPRLEFVRVPEPTAEAQTGATEADVEPASAQADGAGASNGATDNTESLVHLLEGKQSQPMETAEPHSPVRETSFAAPSAAEAKERLAALRYPELKGPKNCVQHLLRAVVEIMLCFPDSPTTCNLIELCTTRRSDAGPAAFWGCVATAFDEWHGSGEPPKRLSLFAWKLSSFRKWWQKTENSAWFLDSLLTLMQQHAKLQCIVDSARRSAIPALPSTS